MHNEYSQLLFLICQIITKIIVTTAKIVTAAISPEMIEEVATPNKKNKT